MTIQSPSGRWYGAKRDKHDPKDRHFMAVHSALMTAPILPSTDFRSRLPPAYDQGHLGRCGPESLRRFMAFVEPGFDGSSLGPYWDVRDLEGTVEQDPSAVLQDTGVETRDLFTIARLIGVGPASEYPDDITKFTQKPSPQYYGDAMFHRLSESSRLTTAHEMLACLSGGMLFISGFQVPPGFESDEVARTGILTMAHAATGGWDAGSKFIGGHDVCCVGHEMNFKAHPDFLKSGLDPASVPDHMLLYANSWGPWGLDGYFWAPLLWMVDFKTGSDNWTGRK